MHLRHLKLLAMTLLFLVVASESRMTRETRSTAVRAGRALKSWFGITLYLITRHAILLEAKRPSLFPRHESKEMDRQPLGEERSRPAFGRKTTSANLKADEKCPCFRHAWKESLTRSV